MIGILHWRYCGTLSLMLAIVMLLPTIAASGTLAESSKPVVISNSPGDYKVSIGRGEDARVGTKGVIAHNGKDIAKFEITDVQWGFSKIRLFDEDPVQPVLVGDAIRLTSVPSPPQIKGKSGIGKALGFVLVLGALVALGGKGGGGGGNASGDVASLSLTATQTSLPADGSSSTQITATVVDGNNAAVPDGTEVQFESTSGAVAPAQVQTSSGQAIVTLTAGSAAGPCTVTATAGGKTAHVTISFLPSDQGNRGSITLTATPTSIQVLNSGGADTESTIVATCRDAEGNLATSGTVTFTSSIGSVIGTASINPADGTATTTFSSSQTGEATITASWDGAEADIDVTVTAGPPHAINVECTPAAIECNGNAFASVTATITDIAGNAVTDGTVVNFSVQADINGGGNGTITPEMRTSNGEVTALLFSRDSTGGVANPGTATAVVQVLRAAQLAQGLPAPAADIENHETQVQFTSLDVAEIHIGANPINIRGWDFVGRTTTISAVVYDSHHNPVPDGTAVYFTADHGMIYGNGGTSGGVALSTTSLGRANATLVSDASGDGTWDGLVDVTATSGDVTVTVPDLVIFSGPPIMANCSLDISPSTIYRCQDSATITVVALDINGNPVVDGTRVELSATKGTLSDSAPTTMSGVVQVTLSTSPDCGNPTALGTGTLNVSIDSGGTGLPVHLSDTYEIN